MQSTVILCATVNCWLDLNSAKLMGTLTCPTTSNGVPLAASAVGVSGVVICFWYCLSRAPYHTTDTEAPKSSKNCTELPINPITLSTLLIL